jgi:hypothetical protein
MEALAARHVAVWKPGGPGERRVLADELVAVARRSRALEMEALGHHFLAICALERNDGAAAGAQLDDGERIVARLPLPHLSAAVAWTRSMLATLEGSFDDAERLLDDNFRATRGWSESEAFRTWSAQLLALRWHQGRATELESPLRTLVDTEAVAVNWRTALALMLGDAGRVEEGREAFAPVAAAAFDDVPPDLGRLFNLALRAEAAVLLDDGGAAADLLRLLAPFGDDGSVVMPTRLVYFGPLAFHLGSLELVTGDLGAAVDHLDGAVVAAERAGSPPFAARARERLALALARRGRAGDADRAAGEAKAALASAESLGMTTLVARLSALTLPA